MKLLLRRFQTEWPSWMAVAFIALLPFGRLAEIPLSLFALTLPFLLRKAAHRETLRRAIPLVVPLFPSSSETLSMMSSGEPAG